MPTLKYFERIHALIAADRAAPPAPLPPFDFDSLGSKSAIGRWLTRFALRRALPALAFVLRQLWPNPRFGRVVIVTRAEDVAQVLNDQTHFHVVYGEEMRDLGGGADNVLSIDGPDHDQLLTTLIASARRDDIEWVSQCVAEDAAALIAAGAGRLDAVRDLITRTATEAVCRLFGLTVHDPDTFGQWTMAVSTQLFGDFFGDANVHRQAKTASAHLSGVIDDAIARVNFNNAKHPHSRRPRDTMIDRMITDLKLPPDQVRAAVIGLITAFVPTNTLAAGNILEVLLGSPDRWRAAVKAALAPDPAVMRALILETGQLNPALSPGLWRHVPVGVTPPKIGDGRRARQARAGDLVLACIPSALRDGRLLASRAGDTRAWMMFGAGPHVCWGAELALAHLTSVFRALFAQRELRPAPDGQGIMERTGAFPVRLDVTYASPGAKRAMILAAFPVRDGVARRTVKQALDALGNPAKPRIAASLSATGRVQFASLSVIERKPGAPDSIVLFEVSGDGDEHDLLEILADHAFDWLAPVISLCRPATSPIADKAMLAAALRDGYFALDQRPYGHTGLHFDGMPELSVADILRQQRVATFARRVLARRLKTDLGLNTRAMGLLLYTKRLMRGDGFLALRSKNARLQKDSLRLGLRGALLRPGRKRLAIADWRQPDTWWPGLWAMLRERENRFIPITVLLLFLGWYAILLAWWTSDSTGATGWALAVALGFVTALPLALITAAVPIGLLTLWLYYLERRDAVDESAAPLEHVRAIAAREDAPGYVQNHILAVMPFKPGILRRLTFAFTMWGILQTVKFFFRPGFVVTMGTIHKARWFRVPGTEQFVFFSNYDGSWESYLEDFITRAHQGQTAAWSHGVGFPRTRLLIGGGASDGDRFKRWVRLQQRETRFWYSRFPGLTAQQIRNNAMIEDGLARATSDTDARRWLASFGSAQRELDELETDEAQSIAFSGLPKMLEATALLLRLPDKRADAGKWLSAVSGLTPSQADQPFIGPPERWLAQDGKKIALPASARVLFGDQSWDGGGATIGLSAHGLEHCGLSAEGGLDALPAAFRMTMGGRARLLGDEASAVPHWRFSDVAAQPNGAHAIMILYGHEEGLAHGDLVAGHEQLLAHFGGERIHAVPCTGAATPGGKISLEYEHFGFRDGISQPVIAGTRRAANHAAPGDLVAAGEILIGYRNNQGYLPITIAVGPERDPACELPTISASDTNRYPWYGNRSCAFEPRDFGRNGTFMAVRQLDQDVDGFWAQADDVSRRLAHDYPRLSDLPGHKLSKEWVAARIIGRWPNGTPLVGNPNEASRRASEQNGNDFTYGVDDPRGLSCPLGAHIRRTNPRDSQEPGDEDERRITNRHRLLRRGRAYKYAADGTGQAEKTGLLFIALGADLERQFEFVQRTWANSTVFHGLVDEHDPLLGPGQGAATTAAAGYFTIPTVAGPIRLNGIKPYVSVRGGGYFFVPSRSALAHLVTRSQN